MNAWRSWQHGSHRECGAARCLRRVCLRQLAFPQCPPAGQLAFGYSLQYSNLHLDLDVRKKAVGLHLHQGGLWWSRNWKELLLHVKLGRMHETVPRTHAACSFSWCRFWHSLQSLLFQVGSWVLWLERCTALSYMQVELQQTLPLLPFNCSGVCLCSQFAVSL